jgi:hypothetical protein
MSPVWTAGPFSMTCSFAVTSPLNLTVGNKSPGDNRGVDFCRGTDHHQPLPI